MKAKEVYERNERDIKIISDAMRKRGAPGHVDTRKGAYIGSSHPFEPELDFISSQVVGGEIIGNETMCQVVPIGTRDLKLVCVQTEDNKASELSKCVGSISKDIIIELANLALEQESTVIDIIHKVRNGQMTDEQAAKEMSQRLAKSYQDEQEILNYYKRYRDEHCGKINKTLSAIETRGSKVVETKTRSTKTVYL